MLLISRVNPVLVLFCWHRANNYNFNCHLIEKTSKSWYVWRLTQVKDLIMYPGHHCLKWEIRSQSWEYPVTIYYSKLLLWRSLKTAIIGHCHSRGTLASRCLLHRLYMKNTWEFIWGLYCPWKCWGDNWNILQLKVQVIGQPARRVCWLKCEERRTQVMNLPSAQQQWSWPDH